MNSLLGVNIITCSSQDQPSARLVPGCERKVFATECCIVLTDTSAIADRNRFNTVSTACSLTYALTAAFNAKFRDIASFRFCKCQAL